MNRYLSQGLAIASILAALMAASGAGAQTPSPMIAAAVADPARPEADKARDKDRKPAEIVAFAGVKPGQKVAELFPGGGYYSRILSKAVGPDGRVYLITPDIFADRMGKMTKDVSAVLPNTVVLFQPAAAPAPPEPVDVVWTTNNYHDYHNPMLGPADMTAFNAAVFKSLKPGGVFLIVDYQTVPGAGVSQTNTLHRMEQSAVVKEVTAAGFVLDGKSDVLANPKDDHTLGIRDPSIRGVVDQYVLRFRKPN